MRSTPRCVRTTNRRRAHLDDNYDSGVAKPGDDEHDHCEPFARGWRDPYAHRYDDDHVSRCWSACYESGDHATGD